MPAAIAIPAIIGAVGTIGGSLINRSSAGKVADTIQNNAATVAQMAQDAAKAASGKVTDATGTAISGVNTATENANNLISSGTGQANDLLRQIFTGQTANLAPYLQAGQQGVSTLMQMLQPGGELSQKFVAPTEQEAAATPGFQFQMGEAMKALQRSQSAAGALKGGGALKALTQYGQNVASTYYQNAYNNALTAFQTNRQNALGGLTTLANLGQFGTSQYNTAASNYGNQASRNTMNSYLARGGNLLNAGYFGANANINAARYAGDTGLRASEIAGNALTGGANARAAGQVAQGNAWSNMIGGLANIGMGAASQYYANKPSYDYAPTNNNFANWASAGMPPWAELPPNFAPQPNLSLPPFLQPVGLPGGAGYI